MRELPILFSTEMVRALLDGRKSQTRRIVNERNCIGDKHAYGYSWADFDLENAQADKIDPNQWYLHIPLPAMGTRHRFHSKWEPGDLLYVRETWGKGTTYDGFTSTLFRADADFPEIIWRPSIHLPKAASRIWLQVESVGVERLQEISREDVRAEGCTLPATAGDTVFYKGFSELVSQYAMLWESINGPSSWESNPFVWKIKFKVLSTTGRPETI